MSRRFSNIRINKSSDLIIVIVKCSDRIVFRNTCNIGDSNAIKNMLNLLELKGFIDLSEMKKEKGWF